MLGIPASDTVAVREWSRHLSAALDYVLTSEVIALANTAAEESTAYLRSLVALRRSAPTDDLLSRLIQAEEEGQHLSEAEIVSTCMFLFGAGHETTTGLIGNAVLALMEHGGQFERLRATSSLVGATVDETLRYDSPVQMAGRVATEDIELGGKTIREGEVVVILLGAANRDPERFVDPDVLDIGRADNVPLSFGGGIHYCLGAALARAEAHVALRTIAQRMADVRLTTAPRWRDTVVLRGLERLPVAFSARG
jgi:pimeloyl-[acyl-carrier protein] synthase